MSGTSSDDDDLLAQFNASAGALESRLSTAHFSIRHLVRNDAATHDDEVEALTARVPPDSSIPRDASPAFAAPARQRRNARHPAWSSTEHDALAASLQRAHEMLAAEQNANKTLLSKLDDAHVAKRGEVEESSELRAAIETQAQAITEMEAIARAEALAKQRLEAELGAARDAAAAAVSRAASVASFAAAATEAAASVLVPAARGRGGAKKRALTPPPGPRPPPNPGPVMLPSKPLPPPGPKPTDRRIIAPPPRPTAPKPPAGWRPRSTGRR